MSIKSILGKVAVATVVATVSLGAIAEEKWPNGPVTIYMHTKAGGSSDIFIRTLAKSLEPQIGENIIVVNSPGGGGASQMARVRSAKPDGQTLGINTLSHFTGMVDNLKGTFALDDFSWIATTQEDQNLMYVRADSDLNDLKDLEQAAKKRTINVGGFGPVGSTQYISMSMYAEAAGVELNWVAFNSTPDIVAALLGGHIDVGMSSLGGAKSFFDAGRIKGLGVHGMQPLDGYESIKTFSDQGYSVDNSWVQLRGVFGPKGIPEETQQQIADAFHKAMLDEDYQTYARNSGVIDSWLGPVEYYKAANRISELAEYNLKKAGVIE